MEFTGERAIPWNLDTGHIMQPHVMRYAWALQLAAGKRVIDLACGTGYGSFILSFTAVSVMGVDIDVEAIRFARAAFRGENLGYVTGDITTHDGHYADLYVAFECLEHVDDPHQLIARHRPLLWSMPVDDDSKYHVRPYSLEEIDKLTGGALWYQDGAGMIVPRENAWFEPVYALGLTA